jgi:hypothetical protein
LIDAKSSKLASKILREKFDKKKENCVFFIDSNTPVKERVLELNDNLVACHETLLVKFDKEVGKYQAKIAESNDKKKEEKKSKLHTKRVNKITIGAKKVNEEDHVESEFPSVKEMKKVKKVGRSLASCSPEMTLVKESKKKTEKQTLQEKQSLQEKQALPDKQVKVEEKQVKEEVKEEEKEAKEEVKEVREEVKEEVSVKEGVKYFDEKELQQIIEEVMNGKYLQKNKKIV